MQRTSRTLTELIQGKKPVLVDFYASWCNPCKMMHPILEETSSLLGNQVKIVKVDVDKNLLAARSFHVNSVPTLILFQSGKIMWRQSGMIQTKKLVEVVHKFTNENGLMAK
ncbi:MAG: thioredoxin [Cyclobacteriaceae bacterium]